MNKDSREIIDVTCQHAARILIWATAQNEEITVNEAVERAMDMDVDFGHTNNGNTWHRTTARRWGFTPRGIKRALNNRMADRKWLDEVRM